MSHLNRILLKTSQVRNVGRALPHHICLQYYGTKKTFGLNLNTISPFEQNWDCHDTRARGPDKISRNKFGRRDEFYPKIDMAVLQNIRSIAGISVTVYGIGWSSIDLKEKKLIDFGNVLLALNQNKHSHLPTTIFKVARTAKTMLPEADFYILENFESGRGRDQGNVEIQLLSMLTVLLNTPRNGDGNTDRVFIQNRSVLNYLFELNIKNERISVSQKLQRLLNEIVSLENESSDNFVADLKTMKLKLKSDFVNTVFGSQPLQQELTSVAFFLALSFIEMNIERLSI